MSREIREIPLARIRVNSQVREKFAEKPIEFLGESVKEIGLVQPILVRPDGNDFVMLDGERRFRAALLMGMETISAIVTDEELTEEQIVDRQLAANCLREDLSILEKVRAMDRLVKAGASVSDVAKRVGVSVAQASKDLSLLTLPTYLQELIDSGALHKTKGYELAQIADPAKQRAMADELLSKRLTRDEAVARRKELTGARGVAKAALTLGGGRTVTVAGPGLTLESLGAWLLELCNLARKARGRGLSLDTFRQMLRDEKGKDGREGAQ